ncbi:hypothetical protein ACH5RR_014149 [Cinchona calisaya]|uniref:Uncharacterized protein n=1 Tax=Cinchona calisaya TaxID=153742 RepID=A0ABD3A239_9GENT
MFSPSNGITHFAQLSPYLYPSSSSFYTSRTLGLNENNEALLHHHNHHHHQDLLETANMMKATTTSSTTNPQISITNVPLNTHYNSRKQRVKRERHSKICTAQGTRDRRVRLSMDIARKFFGLQDLLGYDKASQTIDWLLTTSKAAIKQLLDAKDIVHDANAKCLCFWSEEGNNVVVAGGTNTEEEDESKKKSTAPKRKRKKNSTSQVTKNPKIVALEKLVKESRARARERARERTTEKISQRKLSEDQKLPDLIIPFSQMGTCKTSDSASMHSTISSLKLNVSTEDDDGFFCFNQRNGGIGTEEIFQESPRIKRKAKSPSSILGLQRNLNILSKEAISHNFNSCWSPIANHENWGMISSGMTWSSLCSVTNRSSPVLQICGIPAEDQSNNNQVQCGGQIHRSISSEEK